jgi:hypothetical protein
LDYGKILKRMEIVPNAGGSCCNPNYWGYRSRGSRFKASQGKYPENIQHKTGLVEWLKW